MKEWTISSSELYSVAKIYIFKYIKEEEEDPQNLAGFFRSPADSRKASKKWIQLIPQGKLFCLKNYTV